MEKAASATKRITRAHRKQHRTSLYKAAVQGAKKGVLKPPLVGNRLERLRKRNSKAKTGKRKRTRLRRRRQRRGGEEFNFQKAIEKTGMEFHIPSYRFAGPGTHMAKRLNGRTGYSLYLFTKEYKDVTSENLMSSSSALALSVAAPVRPSYKASLGSKGGTISRSCSNDFNWGSVFLSWLNSHSHFSITC